MSTSLPTFGVTVKDLRGLMELRGEEGRDKLQEFGGVDILCNKLASSPVTGLASTKSVIDHHRFMFGSNLIPPKKPKTFLKLMWAALHDVTLIILQVAAIASLILWALAKTKNDESDEGDRGSEDDLHGWIDGAEILLTVFVVVVVTACNDYTKERQFTGLQKKIEGDHTFSVIRDGLAVLVPIPYIVVGDICQIKYGDLLPADGIVIQSNNLKIDESALTGESDPINKGPNDPMLLSGTHVLGGSGKMLVTAVGTESHTIFVYLLYYHYLSAVRAAMNAAEEDIVEGEIPVGG